MTYQNPEAIWLQPWCDRCAISGEDRLWCQDNVWDQCDLCERKPARYIIDDRNKRKARAVSSEDRA